MDCFLTERNQNEEQKEALFFFFYWNESEKIEKKREEGMETTGAKKETAVMIPVNEKARNGGIKEV